MAAWMFLNLLPADVVRYSRIKEVFFVICGASICMEGGLLALFGFMDWKVTAIKCLCLISQCPMSKMYIIILYNCSVQPKCKVLHQNFARRI